MKKLAPDFKTIADFRKDNVDCIKGVFKEFVYLCRSLGLYGAQLVAIDGTKFKAVNSKSNNLNEKTVALRLKQAEEKIAEYLKELDNNDATDSEEDDNAQADVLKEKISQLEEKKQQYEHLQEQMKATGQREISLVDPDSRLMRVDSQRLEVGYNIQTSVDAKQHLIVDYDVINNSTDHHQLTKDALAAKVILGVDELDVLSDKGFYVEKDLSDCEDNGVTVFMPIPAVLNPYKSIGVPEPEFYSDRFVMILPRTCMFVLQAKNWLFVSACTRITLNEASSIGRLGMRSVFSGAIVRGINVEEPCLGRSMMARLIV